MKKQMFSGVAFALALCLALPAYAAHSKKSSKKPVLKITTSVGVIEVQLDSTKAPITVKNFLHYVSKKHYDGTIFHRVIPQFMIQGGGMTADLKEKGGTAQPIKNEADNGLKNLDGTIAMARTSDPDSATDQFFINVKDNAFLDYSGTQNPGYAVFGKVTSGMDVVHKIENTPTTDSGQYANVPITPVVIQSIRLKK